MTTPRTGIRYSLRGLILLATVACFCGGFCHLITVRYKAQGVSGAEANRLLGKAMSPARVPDAARRVNLEAGFINTFVAFDIDESRFMRWTADRGWKVKPIGPGDSLGLFSTPAPSYSDIPDRIDDGYAYFGSTHRGGYDVLYDRQQQRAWLLYAHH